MELCQCRAKIPVSVKNIYESCYFIEQNIIYSKRLEMKAKKKKQKKNKKTKQKSINIAEKSVYCVLNLDTGLLEALVVPLIDTCFKSRPTLFPGFFFSEAAHCYLASRKATIQFSAEELKW